MHNTYNNTHNNNYNTLPYQQSDVQSKILQIRSNIRNKYHEQYFRNVRNTVMADDGDLAAVCSGTGRSREWRQEQDRYMGNGYQYQSYSKQHPSYNIKLNNQQQLYPTQSTSSPAQHNTQQQYPNILTTTTITNKNTTTITNINISNIKYNNLNQLANLYNLIHNNPTLKSKPQTTHPLINRILQQIQSVLFTIKQLYHLTSSNNTPLININDNQYNEQYGLLFMLLIIYKQLQAVLMQTNTNTIYRWKLMEMGKDCGEFGMKVLGQFGIEFVKAIQY